MKIHMLIFFTQIRNLNYYRKAMHYGKKKTDCYFHRLDGD